MARPRVREAIHLLTSDIDITRSSDVKVADDFVSGCVSLAVDAMEGQPPRGYPDFECAQLRQVMMGIKHTHNSIRILLRGEQSASSVDALALARLQVEALFNFSFLLQSPENMRLFLKNSWKKKYVRFLLHREEHKSLPRFDEYFESKAIETLNNLQAASFVTDDEKRTIESEEFSPFGPKPRPAIIPLFPTPAKVIEQIADASQKQMLARLYFEYQYLCSFAHGDAEASVFRAVTDPRSSYRDYVTTGQIDDFYQKQILEPPIIYSTISAVQAATEVAALYPSNIPLLAKVANAWTYLLEFSLMSVPIYEIRAKLLLPLV